MSNYSNMEMKGDNAGCGNRAVASHIKDLHAASVHSGSVSSRIRPSRSLAHPPGAASSVLKTPRATSRPHYD